MTSRGRRRRRTPKGATIAGAPRLDGVGRSAVARDARDRPRSLDPFAPVPHGSARSERATTSLEPACAGDRETRGVRGPADCDHASCRVAEVVVSTSGPRLFTEPARSSRPPSREVRRRAREGPKPTRATAGRRFGASRIVDLGRDVGARRGREAVRALAKAGDARASNAGARSIEAASGRSIHAAFTSTWRRRSRPSRAEISFANSDRGAPTAR